MSAAYDVRSAKRPQRYFICFFSKSQGFIPEMLKTCQTLITKMKEIIHLPQDYRKQK